MIVNDIIKSLNDLANPSLQESYDNCGLLVGSPDWILKGVLITLDCTEQVLQEAIEKDCNLIIAHHPVIFTPLKKVTPFTSSERVIIKAIKADIAIYAIHTNLDNVLHGVNGKIAEKLEIKNLKILSPKRGTLSKLITYVPTENTETVAKAIFDAGAGSIGNYSECSFSSIGKGTFKPLANANPFIGKKGVNTYLEEEKLEIIFPSFNEKKIIEALKESHPYEEPAFDIINLNNENYSIGSGLIGELISPMEEIDFLMSLKQKLNVTLIRHTEFLRKKISKIAICGGSGSFLLSKAIHQKADVFVSSDFKYHEFFNSDLKILIADINHYESEVFTKDLIYESLRKKFTNIALVLSNVKTNPISYL